ncbi:unknown [Clostridium sp. CAG:1013]|nr:unknown [Clostridium sp. CAG:1013]
MGILGGFQQQVGQIIGGVGAVLLLTADGPVVPLGHAGVFGSVGLARHSVDLHHFAPHDLQQFQSFLSGDASLVQIFFIVRVHVLVKPSGGGGGGGAHHQEGEPEGLHGFPESFGRLVGNLSTDTSHLQKFLFSLSIRLFPGHFFCQVGVAAREPHPGLKYQDDSFPVVPLFDAVNLVIPQVLQAAFGLLDDALGALLQDLLVLHAHQGESGPQAIAAHGEAAAGASLLVFPGGQHQAGLHKGPQPVAFAQGLPHGADQVAVQTIAGETLVQAVKLRLILGGDGVDLRLQALHLVWSPHSVFILHFQTEGFAGTGAAQHITLLNEDGDMIQHVGMKFGPSQEHRFPGGLFQGFHCQPELFHAQGIFVHSQTVFHAFDSFSHRGYLLSRGFLFLFPCNHKEVTHSKKRKRICVERTF